MAQLQAPLSDVPLTLEEFERAALVDFSVDREAELPVGTQLTWKLKSMIAREVLRPGDRLPSVRELAGFAGVNVNTARATYENLELAGLIASEQGRGTYVAERSGDLKTLDELVRETLARARAGGIDPAELAAAIWAAGAADVRSEPDPLIAIEKAFESANTVCVAGSIFLAGAVRDELKQRARPH